VFLPVNAQPFSTAKSLNRATTALAAGCQVLSVGYPLYSQLESLIYRDTKSLLRDVSNGRLQLSSERIQLYQERIDAIASAASEASTLLEFLRKLEARVPAANQFALVHGHSTNGLAHKMVQAADGLSVASPYCTTDLGFDVVFDGTVDRLSMFVSEKASRRLRPEFKSRLGAASNFFGRKFLKIANYDSSPTSEDAALSPRRAASPAFELATYRASMDTIRHRMTESFGPLKIVISETSPLPFSLAS